MRPRSRPTWASSAATWIATGVEALDLGGRIEYAVAANWKAIAENYSECLHCPGVHPELNELSHYMSGEVLEGAAHGAAAR